MMQVVTAESYDDFDSVMKKLELSAASLAEVAAVKERNVQAPPAGQSVVGTCESAVSVRIESFQLQ